VTFTKGSDINNPRDRFRFGVILLRGARGGNSS
jgi:hypothetical protein